MRSFIIGLSVLFFILSGIITFKSFSISERYSDYQSNPAGTEPADRHAQQDSVRDQLADEQAENRALVENLEATIARLESELASKNQQGDTKPEQAARETKAKVLAVLGAGAFRSGQVAVEEGLMNEVKDLVPVILDSPDRRIIIEGHTDNLPIKASMGRRYSDNMELSFLRAKAVARILQESGVPLERISVIGYGDTRPIASNDTVEGRLENRRVEIRLVPGDREF